MPRFIDATWLNKRFPGNAITTLGRAFDGRTGRESRIERHASGFVEETVPIGEFPDYDITNIGRVFNNRTGRELMLSQVTGGALTVGLMKDGIQCRRSVKLLVAREFVDGETVFNNTPILLDGDETNLWFRNIRWRSRGFAWEYRRQFTDPSERAFLGPVVDLTNGYRYETVMDAAVVHGALCKDILRSIYEWTVEPYTGIRYGWDAAGQNLVYLADHESYRDRLEEQSRTFGRRFRKVG